MKKCLVVSFMLLVVVQLFSQSKDDKWIFGVGVTAVDFYPTKVGNSVGMFNEFANASDHWSISGPRIHISHIQGSRFRKSPKSEKRTGKQRPAPYRDPAHPKQRPFAGTDRRKSFEFRSSSASSRLQYCAQSSCEFVCAR